MTSTPTQHSLTRYDVDRVLYTPERLQKIAAQAAEANSPFALEDRIGLVHDAMALAKSGQLKISAALGLVWAWRSEAECTCLSSYRPHLLLSSARRPRLAGYLR